MKKSILSGGASDEDDVNIIETALREANEEIGLDKKNVEIWCSMPPIPGMIIFLF